MSFVTRALTVHLSMSAKSLSFLILADEMSLSNTLLVPLFQARMFLPSRMNFSGYNSAAFPFAWFQAWLISLTGVI